ISKAGSSAGDMIVIENEKPGFICTSDSESSKVESSPSTAINLVQKLTKDISFVPLFLKVDKHTIVISSIGYSSLENYYGAGTGYILIIITKISEQQ
ncbi:7754_t:CDS:2, partial [Ambispora leptoticha]